MLDGIVIARVAETCPPAGNASFCGEKTAVRPFVEVALRLTVPLKPV